MPYPTQMTLESILSTARGMIEAGGPESLSMGKVAKELGVKTPSLYNHVKSKDALLRDVNTQLTTQLFETIDAALAESEATAPTDRSLVVAQAYRTFAHANPRTFVMAMTEDSPARQPDPDYLVQLILPLQSIVAEIVGEEQSLTALRGLYAVMHGFVLAELTGQLRRGGDLNAAYEAAVTAQIHGIALIE